MRAKDREKEEARGQLRKLCPPGSTVYTILRHVSRSGMSRAISLYRFNEVTDAPVYLTGYTAKALGYQMSRCRSGAITVGGAGMDMGFHLVHSLSYALHGMHPRVEPGDDYVERERTAHEEWILALGITPEQRDDRRLWGHHLGPRPGYTLRHEWL